MSGLGQFTNIGVLSPDNWKSSILLVGQMKRPLLKRILSAPLRTWEDRLNIFTVGVWCDPNLD